jgi:ketosteroid isomerase-like protein
MPPGKSDLAGCSFLDVDLEASVDRLLSIHDIRALAYRYALAVDSRDLDALVSVFADDVGPGMDSRERDNSYAAHPTVGRAALKSWFEGALSTFEMSVLAVTNHLIDFDGPDRATGTVYCHAEMAVGDQWIRQAIQYRDRYERVDGVWAIRYRQHLMWYSLDARELPLGDAPVRYPASQRGKGALPDAFPTWRPFWESHRTG